MKRLARAAAVALLAVISILAGIAANRTSASDTQPARARIDRILTLVPVNGDTLDVIATILKVLPGDPYNEEVETVRIVDRRGRWQFVDSLSPMLDPDVGSAVTATAIQWNGVSGLRLDYRGWPDYPPGPPDARYFVLRGRRLVPVTPWCSSSIGPDSSNRIRFELSLDYFSVYVLARVRVDRPEGGLELVTDAGDASGGPARLRMDYPPVRRFLDDDGQPTDDPKIRRRVRLFAATAGEASAEITLTAASKVTFGDAYGDVALVPTQPPPLRGLRADVRIRRIEVTVDGRHGFIQESDFRRFGLEQIN